MVGWRYNEILKLMDLASSRGFMLFLLVSGWIVRLAALLALRQLDAGPDIRTGGQDSVDFYNFGLSLANGHGFVVPGRVATSFRAPGFPMYLAVIDWLSGNNHRAVNLSFPILGAAACVVSYLLGREVVSERAARVAGLLSVVYFPAIYYSTVWLSETLFIPCCGLSLWLLLVHLRTGARPALAAAGLSLACAALIRPFALLLIPAFLVMEFLRGQRRVSCCLLFVACGMTPILMWTARNYRVHHDFVLIATNGGATFYGANNDVVLKQPRYMGSWITSVSLPNRKEIDATPNEVAHDRMEWKLGVRWVQNHLAAMPFLLAMKLARFWLPKLDSDNRAFTVAATAAYLPFLALFLAAFRAAGRGEMRTVPWSVLHITILSNLATTAVFYGSPRFRDANFPALMVYAAYVFQPLLWRIGARTKSQSGAATSSGCL